MIYSFSPFGYEGCLVNVEVDLRRGIPAVDIVGLSDGCVAETRVRVRAAIKNQDLEFPSERVLIALSPCDLKKEGAGFDLPLALAILEAQYGLDTKCNLFCMGELELSGNVRNVKGVNAGLQTAFNNGITVAIVPETDGLIIPSGMKVKTVSNLTDAYFAMCDVFNGDLSDFKVAEVNESTGFKVEFNDVSEDESLDKITGHNGLKFAMAVAVAGKHHLLVHGAPGCGKTMLLMRMPQLMPKLTADEKPSVDRIYSLAGMSGCLKGNTRPFRIPHQTASIEGMCGGGATCRPGEISLAHNGILFLDEAAEFRTSVLQMLRVPLETKSITLSRAGRCTVYPANFQLVMATNPCPCGNYGSKDKICLCSAKSVELYWRKFSGPLLDRVQIRFDMTNEAFDDNDMPLEKARSLIKRAWERQYKRQGKINNELDPQEMNEFCKLSEEARKRLDEQTVRYGYSPRTISNIIKVARTLHDMFDETESNVITDVDTAIALHGKLPLENL